MQATVEKITPKAAENYLGKNVNFRKISQGRLNTYIKDFKNGVWEENGESIKFDNKGNLIDGQHRLKACVETGVSFVSVVVRDIIKTANIDRGKNRTVAQLLAFRGEINANQLSASLYHLYAYRKTNKFYKNAGRGAPSANQIIQLLEDNPKLSDSITKIRHAAKLFANFTLLVALHYVFAEKTTTEKADAFFEPLIKGTNLTEIDARTYLRNRLIIDKTSKARLLTIEVAALVIKAWNAFIEERAVKVLRWSSVGNNPEDFPVIAGIKISDQTH